MVARTVGATVELAEVGRHRVGVLNHDTKADEGTRSGGSITSRKREQEWALTHTGNWAVAKLDVNGDGDFVDTNEYNDSRTHNKANEITGQDTDSNSSDNYTPVYDAVGNLTDDNHNYKYVYDPFGRVVTVKNQSSATIAEYKYNGLGFRIAFHEDSDSDGDVDSNDKWYYLMYDPDWRLLSVFRESDTSPKEEFVVHNAGLDGFGGSSMLDGVICRYKDSTSVFTHASDGVLEEKVYICQNFRGDVSAIVTSDGKMKEWVKYSAYGIPFAMPAGDADSDGDCDTTDVGQILTWKNAPAYDVRGDLDLDGDIDATDRTTAISSYQGTTLGWGILSNIGNRKGYAGYERDINLGKTWHVRNRVLDSELGVWIRRDPELYFDSLNLYQYVRSNALLNTDPMGTGVAGWLMTHVGGGNAQEGEVADSWGLLTTNKVRVAASTAKSWTKNLPGQVDGVGDAMRHCMWNCLMVKSASYGAAEEFANAHEGIDRNAPESKRLNRDNKMDLFNNNIGRDCGLAKSDEIDTVACYRCCWNAYIEGKLDIMGGVKSSTSYHYLYYLPKGHFWGGGSPGPKGMGTVVIGVVPAAASQTYNESVESTSSTIITLEKRK